MTVPEIDAERCNLCGICVDTCPGGVLLSGDQAPPRPEHAQLCIACGHCVAVCPQGAVSHPALAAERFLPQAEQGPDLAQRLLDLMLTRRSTRVFRQKPVAKETLEALVQAACLAPSAHNTQSPQYLAVADPESLRELGDLTAAFLDSLARRLGHPLLGRLMALFAADAVAGAQPLLPAFRRTAADWQEGKDTILHGAPALLLCHSTRRVTFAEANAQLALQNAALMAHALGLGSFFTGFVVAACQHNRKLPWLLGIPPEHTV